MKAKELKEALELVKGAASSKEADLVEFSPAGVRTGDNMWWASSDLVKLDQTLVLPLQRMRDIVKTIPEDEEVTLDVKSNRCTIKAQGAVWRLNLRESPVPEPPEIEGSDEVVSSGYDLAVAVKALKHLMRDDLSRPGLLSAWASSKEELVVGDGSRLGGHSCGVSGVEIPTLAAAEIARVLNTRPSETLTWTSDDKFLKMKHSGGVFITRKPTDEFEKSWYERVMTALDGGQEASLSLSEFKRTLAQAKVTAVGNVKITERGKQLILETKDETDEKSVATLEMDGTLGGGAVVLDIEALTAAATARASEMIFLEVCEKVVRVYDENGWEILPRKEVE